MRIIAMIIMMYFNTLRALGQSICTAAIYVAAHTSLLCHSSIATKWHIISRRRHFHDTQRRRCIDYFDDLIDDIGHTANNLKRIYDD